MEEAGAAVRQPPTGPEWRHTMNKTIQRMPQSGAKPGGMMKGP